MIQLIPHVQTFKDSIEENKTPTEGNESEKEKHFLSTLVLNLNVLLFLFPLLFACPFRGHHSIASVSNLLCS